jgi:hypothetical protein
MSLFNTHPHNQTQLSMPPSACAKHTLVAPVQCLPVLLRHMHYHNLSANCIPTSPPPLKHRQSLAAPSLHKQPELLVIIIWLPTRLPPPLPNTSSAASSLHKQHCNHQKAPGKAALTALHKHAVTTHVAPPPSAQLTDKLAARRLVVSSRSTTKQLLLAVTLVTVTSVTVTPGTANQSCFPVTWAHDRRAA